MNTVDAVARLAAFGLPGVDPAPIALDDPDAVLADSAARRALPWVAAADGAGLVVGVSDQWRADLRRRHLGAVQSTMAAHAAAIDVAERLRSAGICDARILKGCATAHLDYERPIDRFSTDVDLLLRPTQRSAFLAQWPDITVPAGPRERWQRQYGKATTLVSSTKVEIDVHMMLGNGYFGMVIPLDELFVSPVAFEIGGVQMQALDGPNRLIHAANHLASAGFKGLHSIRDVLQLVLVSEVDWESAVARAERWKIEGLFAQGMIEAWGAFPVPPHPILKWARGVTPRGRQRFALSLASDRRSGHLLTAPAALPVYRWPGYVLPMVFPSRVHLAQSRQGWSWRTRMRRMMAQLNPRRR